MLSLVKQMGVILCAQALGVMCSQFMGVKILLIFVAMTGHCYPLMLLSTCYLIYLIEFSKLVLICTK